MEYFDTHPGLYATFVVIATCFACWHSSDLLFKLARIAKRWAAGSGRWAARPFSYKDVAVVAGLFALAAIVILAITDQNILSFSFYVIFPGDKLMRVLAGLAYTLCEILVGHLCAEAIGFTRLYLDRLFSPRQRAILFLFFSIALAVLLSNEYGLAYRRSLLMVDQTTATATVIGQQADAIEPSADDIATAHCSGLVAFAVGLADVVIGFTLAAAFGVIANVADGLARVILAGISIVLRLVGIIVLGASRLLRFPQATVDSIRGFVERRRSFYEPLAVFRKVRLLEPGIKRGAITYADAKRLLWLAAQLDRPDISDEDWQRASQEYNTLVRTSIQQQQEQNPRTDP